MTHDPNAALFTDEGDETLARLVALVREESAALEAALSGALAVQWQPSPVPKPRDDTTERAKGGHGDPTPSIVADGRRLDLRAQVEASRRTLRDAAVAVRGVRRGLEIALLRWEGAEESGEPTA